MMRGNNCDAMFKSSTQLLYLGEQSDWYYYYWYIDEFIRYEKSISAAAPLSLFLQYSTVHDTEASLTVEVEIDVSAKRWKL